MVQQTRNFVTEVAVQANISLGNTLGTLTKPGSIAEYANNAAGNFDKIAQIGMHAAALAEKTEPSVSDGPSIHSGPSFARSVLGGAALTALISLGAVAPAAVAIGGVAMAVGEAISFSVGHAAVNGAQGELTMAAASAATFDSKGEMTSYTSACDNVTSDVKSGQAIIQPAPAPMSRERQLEAVVGNVAGQYDAEQIQRDVRSMLDKAQRDHAWASNKLEMLGFKDHEAANKDLGVDDAMTNHVKPRPKALNVGMGAPAAFGMG